MQLDLYDIETNGLLTEKREKDGRVTPPMSKMWGFSQIIKDLDNPGAPPRRISACNHPDFKRGSHWYHPGQGPDEDGAIRYHEGEAPEGAIVWERMQIEPALRILQEADIRVAHNGQDFDERAIPRVYPWFMPKAKSKLLDTLILSRLIYPDIHRTGPNNHRLFPHEKRMHGVEAWGKRLGQHKGEYTHWCKAQGLDPWAEWRPEMQAYQDFDVEALDTIFSWLWAQKPATTATTLEHEFAAIIRRMESWGWAYNYSKGETLQGELVEKATEMEAELIGAFGEWWEYGKAANSKAENLKTNWKESEEDEDEDDEEEQLKRAKLWEKAEADTWAAVIVPTRSYRRKLVGLPDVTMPRYSEKTGKRLSDYVGPPLLEVTQGNPYTPIKRVQFNPSSRPHIYKRLMAKYGWKPVKFTPGGKTAPQPKIDEGILRGLPFPEADMLAEYFLVMKRLGQLATGPKAWQKVVRETEHPNGQRTYRVHGRVNTGGAGTGRCTHSDPNVSQVPANNAAVAEYPDSPELHGHRCRDLFEASPGFTLAGFDGAAIELRMLAHYLFPFDNGAYAKIVHEGKKEEGTDPHSWLRDLLGTNLMGAGSIGRDHAKTTMYAKLYGGGALRLGEIIMPKALEHEKMAVGREVKEKMAQRFEAVTELETAITEAVLAQGFLTGLDGRKLYMRKPHAALNSLLQSAGAVVMKKALVILDRDLQADGFIPGRHYEFCGNIHDEAQADVLPEFLDRYKAHALNCLPKAGQALKLLCPLMAEVSDGPSWKYTH